VKGNDTNKSEVAHVKTLRADYMLGVADISCVLLFAFKAIKEYT
jgi:hypothetical protein